MKVERACAGSCLWRQRPEDRDLVMARSCPPRRDAAGGIATIAELHEFRENAGASSGTSRFGWKSRRDRSFPNCRCVTQQ
jgi:hypothetical protein